MAASDDLIFPGPERPIRVGGAAALAEAVGLLLPGWPAETAPGGAPVDIPLSRTEEGFRVGRDGESLAGVQDAAVSIVNRVITAALAQRADRLCLHAAGILTAAPRESGAVLLVGESGTGKSTLALLWASAQGRFLGDDVVVVEWGGDGITAAGLGLAAKVRLPVPPAIAEAAGDYLHARQAGRLAGVAYLHPRRCEMAPHGRAYPVRAVICLERCAGADAAPASAPARLSPLSRSEAMRILLANCYAPHLAATQCLAAIDAVTARVPCQALRFHDSRAAIALIQERFA